MIVPVQAAGVIVPDRTVVSCWLILHLFKALASPHLVVSLACSSGVSEFSLVVSFYFVVFPLICRGMLSFPLEGLRALLGPNPVHTMGEGQVHPGYDM